MDYGLILPSYIYEKLTKFVKGKPKAFKTLVGFFIGIPLVIIDFLLAFMAPVLVLFILMYAFTFLPQNAIFFLYNIILMGMNRYAISRNRKPILVSWQGYFIIITIYLAFRTHGWTLPLFAGLLFMATAAANGIINAMIIYDNAKGAKSSKLEIARKATELMFFAMTVFFSI